MVGLVLAELAILLGCLKLLLGCLTHCCYLLRLAAEN
jgi:hypothetical protein